MRKRWFSRRAVLLHLAVAVVAPGCVAAGWWQATRALAGNSLSWAYSIEWPAFALLSIAGWWQLIHEDPESLKARKQRPLDDRGVATESPIAESGLQRPAGQRPGAAARLSVALAVLLGIEFALGIVTALSLSIGRPSGWLPARGEAIYLAHVLVSLPLGFGAAALIVLTRASTRTYKMVGWMGFIGIALAGVGGLLTVAQPARFFGMVLMFVGPTMAGLGYLIPVLGSSPHETPRVGSATRSWSR
ncbi:MAG: hypothetical protein ACYCSF_12750 [Acidimicrobiales bacterium]